MEKFSIERKDVGRVIGKAGRIKKLIEKELEVKISVTKAGNVTLIGQPMQTYLAMNVISALVFGFSVEDALQLKSHDYALEIISVKDFAKSKARQKEIKGRLIGTSGRVKETIQQLGDVGISVHNNKIAILGKVEDVAMARNVVQALLKGAKHARIYKWLEHKSRRFRE